MRMTALAINNIKRIEPEHPLLQSEGMLELIGSSPELERRLNQPSTSRKQRPPSAPARLSTTDRCRNTANTSVLAASTSVLAASSCICMGLASM